MAIIPQQTLFVWSEIENLGDLERLRLVLEYMPDEELMQSLERKRKNGRDDYPVRAMWNSIIAGIVYQHPTVESLRRELSRNGQLRFMCGFRNGKVPKAYVYTRFLNNLLREEKLVHNIFDKLVDELENLLPSFGTNLAIDGKAISSLSKGENKTKTKDGRRDLDANWSKKEYKGVREDGTAWSKVVKWFGYRLHLIVDADYEFPIAYELTKASVSEVKQAHKMIDDLNEAHPELIERCETLEADRGYDDTKLLEQRALIPSSPIKGFWNRRYSCPVKTTDIQHMRTKGQAAYPPVCHWDNAQKDKPWRRQRHRLEAAPAPLLAICPPFSTQSRPPQRMRWHARRVGIPLPAPPPGLLRISS
jgi:hypothetical protein